MTVAIRNRKASNTTGGTATAGTGTGLVPCRKLVLKEGARIIYNDTFAEPSWPEVLRKVNSLFMGLATNEAISFTAKGVMARPKTPKRH